MKKNKILDLTRFEVLGQSANGQLVSGFSMAVTATLLGGTDPVGDPTNQCTVNNCNGGNCTSGCQTNKILCV